MKKRLFWLGLGICLATGPVTGGPGKYRTQRSPALAVTLSLVPGGGQAYNRKFLKAGVLFCGAIGLGVARQLTEEPELRDTVSWWLVGLYFYNLVDAYVDAHLAGFDEELDENIIPPQRQREAEAVPSGPQIENNK
jgi:hypothetical protein